MEFSDGNPGIEYVFQFDPSNRLSFKDAYMTVDFWSSFVEAYILLSEIAQDVIFLDKL